MTGEPDPDLRTALRHELTRRQRLSDELVTVSGRAIRLGDGETGSATVATAARRPLAPRAAPQRGAPFTQSVTIVIPVHNAADELRRCLAALARNTTRPARLVLVEDSSNDPAVEAVLELAAQLDGVEILRNVENLGFTSTVNRGLRAADGDVVLLNSDTEVPPRWLERLVGAAYADPSIGTVTPFSDNAGAFSAPRVDQRNPAPEQLGTDALGRLVSHAAIREVPDGPTGNGFCMYVKRGALESVGSLDAAAFPRGYGEENDFCMRAEQHGWRHVVDPTTYVRHVRQASFGPEKAALASAGREQLMRLHPDYSSRARAFVGSASLVAAREQVGLAFADAATESRTPLPRVLYVIHEGGGGTVSTNLDLMAGIDWWFEPYLFTSDRYALRLWKGGDADPTLLREWKLDRHIAFLDFSRDDYRVALREALTEFAIELVHIRHLFKHTLDAPSVAAALDIPVVMSFHDYYAVCPTIHLLDDESRYCGGTCTPGHGSCRTLRSAVLPPLKHAYVHQWREEFGSALRHVDAFVTTSENTRAVHRKAIPITRERPFEIIEHGRDLAQRQLAAAPDPGGPVRLLVPGNLDVHKGAEYLSAMLEADTERRLDVHFLGDVPDEWASLGTKHGAYERQHLADLVEDIAPSFFGIFSICAETYCHSLTEAWSLGVPVVACDIGALGERIGRHAGGWLVPVEAPHEALATLLRAADDPDEWARQQALATLNGTFRIPEMSARYADLYRTAIQRRRPFAVTGHPGLLDRRVWTVTTVGDRHDRVVSTTATARLDHPELAWKVVSAHAAPERALAYGSALVSADLGALTTDDAEQLARVLETDDVPLLLDTGGPPRDETDRRLLARAALVVVPTAQVAAQLAPFAAHVETLDPAIDDRYAPPDAPIDAGAPSSGPIRVLLDASDPDGPAVVEDIRATAGRTVVADVLFERRVERDGTTVASWDTAAERERALAELCAVEHAILVPRDGVASWTVALELARLGGALVIGREHPLREALPCALAVGPNVEARAAGVRKLSGEPALRDELRAAGSLDRVTVRAQANEVLELVGRAMAI